MQIGDILTRPKPPLGLIRHYGVYLGVYDDTEYVIEAVKGEGVKLTTFKEFCLGKPRTVRVIPRDDHSSISGILDRAREMIGKDYNKVSQNCEHVARYIHNGIAESKQVKAVGFIGLIYLGYHLFKGD